MKLQSHLDHIAKVSVTDALTYMERWLAEGFDPKSLTLFQRIDLADAILARKEPGNNNMYRDRLAAIIGLPNGQWFYLIRTVVHATGHPSKKVRDVAHRSLAEFEADGQPYRAYRAVRSVLPSGRQAPPTITGAAEQRLVFTQAIAQLKGLSGVLVQIRELAPEIPREEAAQWVSGLKHNRRVIEQLINRIKEPSHE